MNPDKCLPFCTMGRVVCLGNKPQWECNYCYLYYNELFYSFIWSYTMYRTLKLLRASGKHIFYLIKRRKLYLHMHAPHVHVCACCICVYVCIYTHILYRLYTYIFKCSCSTNIMYTCVWYLLLHRYQFNSYGTKLYSVVGWVTLLSLFLF